MTTDADLVLVGAVVGAFGVHGDVRVRTFTASPEGVAGYGPLLNKAGQVVLTPKRMRALPEGLALSAPEVASREAAQALKGTGLYVPRSALPPTEDDEFYHVDLIGCAVEGLDGTALGTVKAVQDFGAGDLLEVRGPDGKDWYLPFTKAAAPLVNVAARRIVADPPVSEDEPG